MIEDIIKDLTKTQKPVGRPKLSGTHLYIRLIPGIKEKIYEIKKREEIRVGKLTINHIVNHLLSLGIGYYFFTENPKNDPKKPPIE